MFRLSAFIIVFAFSYDLNFANNERKVLYKSVIEIKVQSGNETPRVVF